MADDRGKKRTTGEPLGAATSTPQPSKIIEALDRVRRQKVELAEAEVRRRDALARSAAAMASLRGSMEGNVPRTQPGDEVEDVGPPPAPPPPADQAKSGAQSTKGK